MFIWRYEKTGLGWRQRLADHQYVMKIKARRNLYGVKREEGQGESPQDTKLQDNQRRNLQRHLKMSRKKTRPQGERRVPGAKRSGLKCSAGSNDANRAQQRPANIVGTGVKMLPTLALNGGGGWCWKPFYPTSSLPSALHECTGVSRRFICAMFPKG